MDCEKLTAMDYVTRCEYPIFFYAGVGAPGGQSIAIWDETELPIDLGDLTGTVDADGTFEADNLTQGPGAHDWRFSDWNGNTIYKVRIFSDETIWKEDWGYTKTEQ